jgi:hypothetical protein
MWRRTFSRTISSDFFPARADTSDAPSWGIVFREKKEHAQNRIKYSNFEAVKEVVEAVI